MSDLSIKSDKRYFPFKGLNFSKTAYMQTYNTAYI